MRIWGYIGFIIGVDKVGLYASIWRHGESNGAASYVFQK